MTENGGDAPGGFLPGGRRGALAALTGILPHRLAGLGMGEAAFGEAAKRKAAE